VYVNSITLEMASTYFWEVPHRRERKNKHFIRESSTLNCYFLLLYEKKKNQRKLHNSSAILGFFLSVSVVCLI